MLAPAVEADGPGDRTSGTGTPGFRTGAGATRTAADLSWQDAGHSREHRMVKFLLIAAGVCQKDKVSDRPQQCLDLP